MYATRVGDGDNSSSNAQVTSVAVDSRGDVWLYGETKDSAFPATTTGALQPQCTTPASTSCLSSFLMEIDPTGASVPYATYLGGSGGTNVTSFDIQLDASDTIYVSGYTDQINFPILNGAYSILPGSASNYIGKISSDGKTLLYSTFVQSDIFSVSPDGKVAFTIGSAAGFPLKNNLQTTPPTGNNLDAAFGLLDTTLSGADSLLVSSYLGTNTGYTQPQRVYLSTTGQILIMGETSATDLPVANAYQPASGGGVYDGFLAIIQPNDALTLTPATLTFPSTSVGSTSAAMTATLFNGTTKSIYLIQGTLTDSKDFTDSGNCGILSPQASCTVTFTFTPQSAGTLTSTYSTGDLDKPSVALTIALSGSATAAATPGSDTLSPATVDFGVVIPGAVATKSVTFTNGSNAPITVYNYANSNSAFSVIASTCVITVPANSSCVYTLQFTPTAQGTQTGTFQVADRVSNPSVNVTVTTYIASPKISLMPNPVVLNDVPQGRTTAQILTLTNGSTYPITFSPNDPTVGGPDQAFSLSSGVPANPCVVDNTGVTTLAPGGSCSYAIAFNANIPVDTSAAATITFPYSPPGTSFKYAATATVTANEITDAAAVVSPATIQFPATAAGKTSPAQIVTVTNAGEQPLGFIGATISGTNPAAFTETNNCPASLGKNGACQISVYFTPAATGNEFTANLDVSLSTGDVNVTLNGGTSPSDFVLSSATPPQNTGNPRWVIDVSPLTASIGFNEPITFKVTGLDASYGTPVFTPSTVTPRGGTVTTTLTLTPAPSAAFNQNPGGENGGAAAALPSLACCMAFFFSFRRRLKNYRTWTASIIVVLALTALALTGCGAHKPPVNFTVTATSGSISHNLTLTLQP